VSSPYVHFYDLGTKCSSCGTTENVEIHHKDGNRKNNAIENLVLLCHRCHMQKHFKGRHRKTQSKTNLVDVHMRCPRELKERLDKKVDENLTTLTTITRNLWMEWLDS